MYESKKCLFVPLHFLLLYGLFGRIILYLYDVFIIIDGGEIKNLSGGVIKFSLAPAVL